MLDDVLDVSGPPERTGKPRGADLLDGTVTLPLILARRVDPGCARSTCARGTDAAEAEALCDRIAATGALAQAREQALTHVADAKRGLLELELPAVRQQALRAGGGRRGRALRLEVFRQDGVGPEGADEALDLLGHVGAHQPLVVAGECVGAAVELLVEALDGVLGEDALPVDVAVGAVQQDAPVLRARTPPTAPGRPAPSCTRCRGEGPDGPRRAGPRWPGWSSSTGSVPKAARLPVSLK